MENVKTLGEAIQNLLTDAVNRMEDERDRQHCHTLLDILAEKLNSRGKEG